MSDFNGLRKPKSLQEYEETHAEPNTPPTQGNVGITIILSLHQKRSISARGYDIQYRPRTAIKGQILADFIVERPEDESPDELMAEPKALPEPWTLFTDGSSCVDGLGAGGSGNNNEALGINLTDRERRGGIEPYKKQKARKRWKSITTQESAEQASNRAKWSTAAMKQVMPGEW
ncbi:hypothetical protein Tco_0680275 [Tanacetum coccineum]|uniref:Uncharacterized protein n=1 Tax=Tanacetum coccineum TaxID=301880 RepID=A0ABQ4XKZ6_9ASTR